MLAAAPAWRRDAIRLGSLRQQRHEPPPGRPGAHGGHRVRAVRRPPRARHRRRRASSRARGLRHPVPGAAGPRRAPRARPSRCLRLLLVRRPGRLRRASTTDCTTRTRSRRRGRRRASSWAARRQPGPGSPHATPTPGPARARVSALLPVFEAELRAVGRASRRRCPSSSPSRSRTSGVTSCGSRLAGRAWRGGAHPPRRQGR